METPAPLSAITYGGVPLTLAASVTSANTAVQSDIYYLFNSAGFTSGQSLSVSFTDDSSVTATSIQPFALSGVDTTVLPNSVAGYHNATVVEVAGTTFTDTLGSPLLVLTLSRVHGPHWRR